MKNTILSLLAVAMLVVAFESCKQGPATLTEAEFAQRVDQLTALEIDSLNVVLDEECESRLPDLVAAARDSIIAEKAEDKN